MPCLVQLHVRGASGPAWQTRSRWRTIHVSTTEHSIRRDRCTLTSSIGHPEAVMSLPWAKPLANSLRARSKFPVLHATAISESFGTMLRTCNMRSKEKPGQIICSWTEYILPKSDICTAARYVVPSSLGNATSCAENPCRSNRAVRGNSLVDLVII